MNKIALTLGLVCSFMVLNAQNRKWSVEVNYPISVTGELYRNDKGLIDVGIKYRFFKLGSVKAGFGINASFFRQGFMPIYDSSNMQIGSTDLKTKLISPKLISEFYLPNLKQVRLILGLGYQFIYTNINGKSDVIFFQKKDNAGGFNINLGASYDLAKNIYIQCQYDYLNNRTQVQNFNSTKHLGFLKLGVGFRF